MQYKLTRKQYRSDGIFSELTDDKGQIIAQTLEHAYLNDLEQYLPKIPKGTFTCSRSPHRLHGMTEDFVTFQVMDVPKCSGILFHWGNFNADSEGCVLLGEKIASSPKGQMITNSRTTWAKFMAGLSGVDKFELLAL